MDSRNILCIRFHRARVPSTLIIHLSEIRRIGKTHSEEGVNIYRQYRHIPGRYGGYQPSWGLTGQTPHKVGFYGPQPSYSRVHQLHPYPQQYGYSSLCRPDPSIARTSPASSILVTFLMSLGMSFALSLTNSLINLGLKPSLILFWIQSFTIGVIVGFPSALVVLPAARRIADIVMAS